MQTCTYIKIAYRALMNSGENIEEEEEEIATGDSLSIIKSLTTIAG